MPNYSRKGANERLEKAWEDYDNLLTKKNAADRRAGELEKALEKLCDLHGISDNYRTLDSARLGYDGFVTNFQVSHVIRDLDIISRAGETEGARKRLGLTKEEA